MEYNVILTLKCEQDIDEAFVWYEEQQMGLGLRFYREVRSHLDRLVTTPKSFPVKLDSSIRELTLSLFPFVIVYEIIGEEVMVYRVFSTSQNPKKKISP
ncbi:MAG: type II toxin-antitoxin system RelE/ParE family toxin [Crocinitomicaceae bacterium]